jgi:glutamate--cysteine ligase
VTALSAFWVGLLYDQPALDAAWDLVKSWTAEERQALRDGVPRTALHTPFRQTTAYEIAREALAISTAGLTNRALRDAHGHYETIHLAPLQHTLHLKKTPAERWLDLYNGEWQGDLTRIFAAAEL